VPIHTPPPMSRRLLRAAAFAIVTIVATIVMCAFARPAMAMPAGYCDDRGATAIAPPPVLEAPDVAVRQARAASSCDGDDTRVGEAVAPGHAPASVAVGQGDPGLPTRAIALPPASSESTSPVPEVGRAADGVITSIERPPRV
jgi:hypothetical protein